jgi:hypothetical protein
MDISIGFGGWKMSESQANKSVDRPKKKGRSKGPGLIVPLLIVLGGFILVGLAALALGGKESNSSRSIPAGKVGAKLQVDQEKIDFGDVKLGEWVTATFMVTNVGDMPLEFKEAPFISIVAGC